MTGKQAVKARCRDCIGGNGDCAFTDRVLKGMARGKQGVHKGVLNRIALNRISVDRSQSTLKNPLFAGANMRGTGNDMTKRKIPVGLTIYQSKWHMFGRTTPNPDAAYLPLHYQ
jgi:hypothetical protein